MTARTLYSGATFYARATMVLAGDIGSTIVTAQIASHAVELALKAFLLARGMTEKELSGKDGIGHDLERAWTECMNRGFGTPPPVWLSALNMQYSSPFTLRYWRQGIGWGFPGAPNSFVPAVRSLVLEIGTEIGEDHHGVLGAAPGSQPEKLPNAT